MNKLKHEISAVFCLAKFYNLFSAKKKIDLYKMYRKKIQLLGLRN